jgi:hypothetical protein
VLDFLRDREDAGLFGAQAVNAYAHEPRTTQDIDLLSTRAVELTDELREHLSLIVYRVISYHQGRGKPKFGTDWRDLAMLLLTFPELKTDAGEVSERLRAAGATETMVGIWREPVAQEITAEDEDAEF